MFILWAKFATLLFTALGPTNAFDELQNFRFAVASGSNSILAASPKQAMVWGFAPDGATVVVSFGNHTNLPTTVGPDQADGKLTTFRVLLPATIASFDKYNITATCIHGCDSSSTPRIISTNVMFGEVWLCSGQSNMGYPLGSSTCWNASNTDCKVNDLQCTTVAWKMRGKRFKPCVVTMLACVFSTFRNTRLMFPLPILPPTRRHG